MTNKKIILDVKIDASRLKEKIELLQSDLEEVQELIEKVYNLHGRSVVLTLDKEETEVVGGKKHTFILDLENDG